MKTFYQIIYKEGQGEDLNTEGSQKIFSDIIDAWLYVMVDCENDRDIAHLLEKVSTGEISIKTLKTNDGV